MKIKIIEKLKIRRFNKTFINLSERSCTYC